MDIVDTGLEQDGFDGEEGELSHENFILYLIYVDGGKNLIGKLGSH